MANIKISRKLFEKEIGKLDEKMQEKIALFGNTLENFDDEEMELEIFPDRPDMLSYQGFKRSFLAFIGKKPGIKKYKIHKPEKNFKVKIESPVKEVRPYTACAIIKKLKLNDDKIKELIDLQEKLHLTLGRKRKRFAIGIYPLEKIKLPITYTAMQPEKIKFIPLEAKKEMSGLEILQRHPTGKEYANLLMGKLKFPIFKDANKEILSMPPIINSELTGRVTEKTKEVFVECSGFEKEILEKCLNIIVATLADMGGDIYQMDVNGSKTPSLKSEKRKISIENTNKLLGINLTEKQVKENLRKMGHEYLKGEVEIPPWRFDILHEVDLIEDVAIGYGYENFIPEIPKISTIGKENKKEILKRKISEILIGLKMLEISNYHLTQKSDQFKKMGISEKQEKNFVEIEESKTNYTILRKNLTHYLLKIISENADSEYPQKLFEIGKVFNKKEKEIEESERLCIGIAPGNFTEIKQILLYLADKLEINLKFAEPEKIPSHYIDGRTAEIFLEEKKQISDLANSGNSDKKGGSSVKQNISGKSLNQKFENSTKGKLIGYLGEIHPKILKNWKIKMPVAIFEINLEEIFNKFN